MSTKIPYYEDRTGPGAAYVFVEPATGWASMTQTAELTESQQGLCDSFLVLLNGGQKLGEFGYSIGIDGGVVVIGAPYETVDGHSDQGVVFGFELTPP